VDDRALGMIVAKADDDWVFIHSLEAALASSEALKNLEISCF
jgi:hypothetical protein